MRSALSAMLLVALGLLPWGEASTLLAQERPAPQPASQQPQLPPPLPISPGGAFLRAVLVPGWGHVAIGSYTRGGFYMGAQAATIYTFLRTRSRIGEAQERVLLRETVLRRGLAAEGVTDPDEIDTRLADDDILTELRNLQEKRKGQREDLLAFGIFLVLLSSADAYVSAHLARFPEPLVLDPDPGTGRMDVGLRLPIPH